MSQIAVPMPAPAVEALTRARTAVLAAMPEPSAGFDAARAALIGLSVDELLDVCALLATSAAGSVILTADEWSTVAAALGVDE